ncbi:MAG: nitrilase-related carbon-nitrogen hydrolase, partial [Bacteroidaceae bacterium]
AESLEGETISQLTAFAKQFEVAIVGSFICKDDECYYNRAFFITPQESYYYDKRHLFRMGGEAQSFSSGNERVIVTYKQWHIMLLVCYDLRFPIWSRNRGCEYDLCIYVANWPASRIHVWDALLLARALENQTYICGVNRVGIDGNGIPYNGHSKLIDARGEKLLQLPDEKTCVEVVVIDKEPLLHFREKFSVWMDAD